MPSQRDTKKSPPGGNAANFTRERDSASDVRILDAGRRSVWRLEVPAPRLPAIPTITAVGSSGGLATAIATGHVQPGVVWPAVALAIAGLAYDIAIRALNRPHEA
ncbi:hypothetical protein [Streptomyces sp. NPDC088794]|jgi:hypothetical protein|uniref:hypothetical protein n=1 Tax=Streptomyces sp. NPDC088794 TaxID=3365902 RepID=UPI003810EB4C